MQVPLQTAPQSPQFASSIFTLTQAGAAVPVLHIFMPPGQAHFPSEQTCPGSHFMPQAPQFATFD